jgi:hypothetical protein
VFTTVLVGTTAFAALAPILTSVTDELAHLSYAAALVEHPTLFPRFEELRLLDRSDLRLWTDLPNTASHPVPYYFLLAAVLDRSVAPEQAVFLARLSSVLLIGAGMLVAAVAGLRQFMTNVPARLTFCVQIALCPKALATGSHNTNEALAVFAGALAYAGGACGDRRWRGALLGAGVVLAFWTKLTAGLLVGGWAIALALLLRSPALLLVTAAASLVGSIFYFDMLWWYGALVPLTWESVHGVVDAPTTVAERLLTFASTFPFSWAFAQTGASWHALGFLAFLACVTWGVVSGIGARPHVTTAIGTAAAAAACCVLAVHIVYMVVSLGGHAPAASFRYYLPLWPMLAHAATLPAFLASVPAVGRIAAGVAVASVLAGWLS